MTWYMVWVIVAITPCGIDAAAWCRWAFRVHVCRRFVVRSTHPFSGESGEELTTRGHTTTAPPQTVHCHLSTVNRRPLRRRTQDSISDIVKFQFTLNHHDKHLDIVTERRLGDRALERPFMRQRYEKADPSTPHTWRTNKVSYSRSASTLPYRTTITLPRHCPCLRHQIQQCERYVAIIGQRRWTLRVHACCTGGGRCINDISPILTLESENFHYNKG